MPVRDPDIFWSVGLLSLYIDSIWRAHTEAFGLVATRGHTFLPSWNRSRVRLRMRDFLLLLLFIAFFFKPLKVVITITNMVNYTDKWLQSDLDGWICVCKPKQRRRSAPERFWGPGSDFGDFLRPDTIPTKIWDLGQFLSRQERQIW